MRQCSIRHVLKRVSGLSHTHRSISNTLQVFAESIAPRWIQNRYHRNGFFGSFGSGLERDRHERTLAMVEAWSGAKRWGSALEVGCAEGHFTALLAARCRRVHALDISEVACKRADARCAGASNVGVCQHDFIYDPIEETTYDVVFVMVVLEYVRGARRIVEVANKFVAALRPQGLLVVSDVLASPERDSWIARQMVAAPHERMMPYFQHPRLRLLHQEYHPSVGEAPPPYLKHLIAAFAKTA
jgi:2-polyprenyl-3-methyl-5-hydroxy-6-metoxy-1,4-benzoquinol methylase